MDLNPSNAATNFGYLVVLVLALITTLINCDCGFPGTPPNSAVTLSQEGYREGQTISYANHCPADYRKLVNSAPRVCSRGKWSGMMARCAGRIGKNITKLLRV